MAKSIKRDKNNKQDVLVDSSFISSPELILSAKPKSSSDLVFLNGLLLPDDCYSITGQQLTFDVSLPLEIGDLLMIRYIS